ncbi:hypothetical protein C8R43DRAFT_948956 [Mycena crocata]|nr:hypothetical protein C8R43DRAFT_948956 [Mycena crocata]
MRWTTKLNIEPRILGHIVASQHHTEPRKQVYFDCLESINRKSRSAIRWLNGPCIKYGTTASCQRVNFGLLEESVTLRQIMAAANFFSAMTLCCGSAAVASAPTTTHHHPPPLPYKSHKALNSDAPARTENRHLAPPPHMIGKMKFNELPVDIIREVFGQHLRGKGTSRLFLSWVCRHWKAILFSMNIWGPVDIIAKSYPTNKDLRFATQITDDWLHRATDHSIVMKARFTTSADGLQTIDALEVCQNIRHFIQTIIGYSTRWKRLILYLPDCEQHFLDPLVALTLEDVPSLEMVAIKHHLRGFNSSHVKLPSMRFLDNGKVHDLEIPAICLSQISVSFRWEHLTHLTITDIRDGNIFKILPKCTKLNSCSLVILGGQSAHPGNNIKVPGLQHLSVTFSVRYQLGWEQFQADPFPLTFLDLPDLRSLHYRSDICLPTSVAFVSLLPLKSPSNSPLQFLRIQIFRIQSADLLIGLHSLASLQAVEVVGDPWKAKEAHPKGIYQEPAGPDENFIESFASELTTNPSNFLPRIERVGFMGFETITDQQLVDFVERTKNPIRLPLFTFNFELRRANQAGQHSEYLRKHLGAPHLHISIKAHSRDQDGDPGVLMDQLYMEEACRLLGRSEPAPTVQLPPSNRLK